MSEALTAFLLESYGRSFQFGECDCGLWVGEWIGRIRGNDPGAPFRGSYQTARGCRRLLARQGGLLALASRAFAEAGLSSIDPAATMPGDIACLETMRGTTLGVMTLHGRVAMLAERGLVVSSAYPVLRAWKI